MSRGRKKKQGFLDSVASRILPFELFANMVDMYLLAKRLKWTTARRLTIHERADRLLEENLDILTNGGDLELAARNAVMLERMSLRLEKLRLR